MELRILHRDISFSNLLLTRSESASGSAQFATGLLIDFDYAQQLQSNDDASDETDHTTWDPTVNIHNNFNTRASAESSGVFITVSAETSGASGMIPSLSSTSTPGSAAGGPQVPPIPDRKAATSDTGKAIAGNQRTVSWYFLRRVKITNVNPITREHHPSCLLRASSQTIQISLNKPITTSSHFSISSYIYVPSQTVQIIRSFRKKFLTHVHCANGSRRPPKHRLLVSSRLDTCAVLTYQFCLTLPDTGKT